MFAKNLEMVLESVSRKSGIAGESPSSIEERFQSLRDYGLLPRGRENRETPLQNRHIAACILSLVPRRPGLAGHVAIMLTKLRPVGGVTNAIGQANSLGQAIEHLLDDDSTRGSLIKIYMTTEESGTNSNGFAAIEYLREGERRVTHFMPSSASSLLHAGAEESFEPDRGYASMSVGVVFRRDFFEDVVHALDRVELRGEPPAGDGSEYDEDDAKRERARKLEAKASSKFLHVGVDNHVWWPRKEMLIRFDRYKLILMPKAKEHVQSVHIDLTANRLTSEQAVTVINRFLSVLAWCDDHFAISQGGWSGNPVPVAVRRRNLAFTTTDDWFLDWSIPATEDGRRALALYREARNAQENFLIGYAVLNYFKIIEIRNPEGADARRWISENFNQAVRANLSQEQMIRFEDACDETAPEKYIYDACRVAVAHASPRSPSDPDELEESRRLHVAADAMRLLARHYIKSELGIPDTRFSGD